MQRNNEDDTSKLPGYRIPVSSSQCDDNNQIKHSLWCVPVFVMFKLIGNLRAKSSLLSKVAISRALYR